MSLTELSTGFALLALFVSGLALALSITAARRSSRSYAVRKIGALEVQGIELVEAIDSLKDTIKRANAKHALREARAAKAAKASDEQPNGESDPFAMLPGESPDEWKRRMRRGPLREGKRPG